MSEGFITRKAGGQGIKFSVSNYPSIDKFPATALENSYAIISDKDITKFYISASEPLNPIADSVWVRNSIFYTEESINVISGDRLIITPIEFLQRSGNVWAHKEAYVFKDGAWKAYKEFLVKDGKYTSLLSEFVSDEQKTIEPVYNSKRSFIEMSMAYNAQNEIGTANSYDFKKYSRIGIEYSMVNYNSYMILRARPTSTTATHLSKVKLENMSDSAYLNGSTLKAYLKMEDVMNARYDLAKYPYFGITIESRTADGHSSARPLRVYDLWLE